jgi:glycosyltransferase involved in cell wall biosynthesis
MVGGVSRASGLYRQISARAAHVGNLAFHGQLSYRATNCLFDRARVFVNTSEAEGFPNTFWQAWIRGVPVVSFLDPDDVIRREGLGYAVASLKEMGDAAQHLATDSQAWHETSARCRAYMARCYGEDKILAPYLSTVARIALGLPAAAAPAC